MPRTMKAWRKRRREEDDKQFMLNLFEPDAPDDEAGHNNCESIVPTHDTTDFRDWRAPSTWTLAPGESEEQAVAEYLRHWHGRNIR